MRRQLVPALRMLLVMTALTGLLYPLVVTGIAQTAFADQADGSLVTVDGQVVGSRLIGQAFEGEEWFHPRPSAVDYDGASSGASNLGPSNRELTVIVAERVAAYRELNRLDQRVSVPVDAVTASGSGLDPHISLANALLQAPRVAQARGMEVEAVIDIVDGATLPPQAGILSEVRVNVLAVNIALGKVAP